MRILFAVGIVLCANSMRDLSAAEPEKCWTGEKGITAGQLIQGSTSPDGRYALFEFHHWEGGVAEGETTANGIGLAPVDRSKLLFVVDLTTKWSTDREVPSFSNLLWNSSSSLLATHDSLARNSQIHIYRLHDGAASSVDLPDLLDLACQKLGLSKSSVTASGQLPAHWLDDQTLQVTVRIACGKRKATSPVIVTVAKDGSASCR